MLAGVESTGSCWSGRFLEASRVVSSSFPFQINVIEAKKKTDIVMAVSSL